MENTKKSFSKLLMWNGKELKNMGDVMNVVHSIALKGNKKEALEFRQWYRDQCNSPEIADKNIGYSAGYYSKEIADSIWDLFEVNHPVFGTKQPTPKEAFEMGLKMGEEIK